jgi:hypothetical protein
MSDLGLQFERPSVEVDAINILSYGPSGVGKSTAAATAPGPLLWANAEGPGALAFARKTATERGTEIHEARLTADLDAKLFLRSLIEHVRSGAEPQCKTLVVDTVGRVREHLVRQLVNQGSKNSLQQYGEVSRVLAEFVRLARDLPINVVLIAHEDIADQDGDRVVRPLIGGNQTELIPGEMDVVAYHFVRDLEDGERAYEAMFIEHNGRRAKDRSGGLGRTAPADVSVWIDRFRDALRPVPTDDVEASLFPEEPAKSAAEGVSA